MFKQSSRRISMVVVVALALLLLLITSTTGQTRVALAKADGGRDLQQASARQMKPMTDTMPMGQMGMGRMMQMMGTMMQMRGMMEAMMPADMGAMTGAMPMTSTMPMTGAMDMGSAEMMQMMGMMSQMHNLMMKQMQSMLASCSGVTPTMGAMTMTGSMMSTMPMTGAMSMGNTGMDQMMSQMMQSMMGMVMGVMSNTMPMTGTMAAMHQPGSSDQRVMMGRRMQIMGMMMQMMGQMQDVMGAGMGVMSNTLLMTGTMPLRAELCPMMGMMNQMMGGRMQPFDLRFIDRMIMHHQGAVAMAQAAQTKAEHAELKTLATAIIAAQTAEITQMQAWRTAWYPNAPVSKGLDMSMGAMQIADDPSTPFDLRFIEAMIPHHQSAIDMASMAQTQALHPEIKTLAANIIKAQTTEIMQMQAWKATWFKP